MGLVALLRQPCPCGERFEFEFDNKIRGLHGPKIALNSLMPNFARVLVLSLIAATCSFSVQASRDFCSGMLELLSEKHPEVIIPISEMARAAQIRMQANAGLVEKYNSSDHGLMAEWDAKHETMRVFAKDGRVPEAAKARVLVLPGMGWTTSGVQLIHEMARVLGDPKAEGDSPDANFARKIHRSLGASRVIVGAEVVSMPGQDLGPAADRFMTPEKTVDWLKSYIDSMKAETPNLPIVVLGWSASAPFLAEFNRKYPLFIDGQVIVAPSESGGNPIPHLEDIKKMIPILSTVNTRLPILGRDDVKPEVNKEAVAYMIGNNSYMKPNEAADYLRAPTLVIYSDQDSGVYEKTREAIEAAAKSAKVWDNPFTLVKTAGYGGLEHEPFNSFNVVVDNEVLAPFGEQAYGALNKFLQSVSDTDNPASHHIRQAQIETERLSFRPLTKQDAAFAKDLFDDESVKVFFGVDWQEELTSSVSKMASGTGSYVVISDRHTREQYGVVVFWDVTPESLGRTDNKKYTRRGIALYGHAQGKGIGNEAIQALTDYLLKVHGSDHVISRIDPRNIASVKFTDRRFQEFTVPHDPNMLYFSNPPLR